MLPFGFRYGRITVVALLVFVINGGVLNFSVAEAANSPVGQFDVKYTHSVLSNDLPSQDVLRLGLVRYLTRSSDVSFSLEQASLFNQSDQTLSASYFYYPPGSIYSFNAGGSFSPSSKIVARNSAYAGFGVAPDGPGYLDFAVFRTDYDTPVTQSLSATAGWSKRYYQCAYTLSASRISGGSAQLSHTLSYDNYTPSGNRYSVSLSGGEQPRRLSGNETITTEFMSVSLSGFRELSTNRNIREGVTYGITARSLDNEYDSLGFSLGYQQEF
ncbi:MAG: YaiO family outer membrane beta-barrel protein [bacterium]